jgi:hypothetical protein
MDLTFSIENHLDEEFCKEIIQRFEEDENKFPGQAGGSFKPHVKVSIDLGIHNYEKWADVVLKLQERLFDAYQKYDIFLKSKFAGYDLSTSVNNTGFQIQKSGSYKWHEDSNYMSGFIRTTTFIWYLNEKPVESGTGLYYKTEKPETGKLFIFPATWPYVHCGFPAEDKYIITGWTWRKKQDH